MAKFFRKSFRSIIVLMIAFTMLICSSCVYEPEKTTQGEERTFEAFITDNTGKVIPAYSAVEINELDAALFEREDNDRMTYKSDSVKTFTGIDVSMFQGDIDWQAVAADGIDFAILRIGGRGYGAKGVLYADERFETNYTGAVAAGLKVGVYFFSQAVSAEEAKEEAEFALKLLGDKTPDYPFVFDWEVIENEPNARTAGITDTAVTQCANAFCRIVENAGFIPVIYFNRSTGYDQYILSEINNYDFWIAEYTSAPYFYYNFSIWQYTTEGTVAGIEGTVDLNICFTDYSTQPETQTSVQTKPITAENTSLITRRTTI